MQQKSKTNSGVLNIFENIIRSHPLVYYFIRSIIRYTNIFEEDAIGVKYLNLRKKVNVIDVGASDGIATKYFLNNLNVNKITCYEPYKPYIEKIKKLNTKKIVIKSYAIGNVLKSTSVYFPRYRLFGKNFDLITYTYYDKKSLINQIKLDFKFNKNIKVIKNKIKIKKFKKPSYKIDLIKIDVNGFELSVLKSMIKCIRKDHPVILLETGDDIQKINSLLKKFSYIQFEFSLTSKKFKHIKNGKYPLNTYFIHEKNL